MSLADGQQRCSRCRALLRSRLRRTLQLAARLIVRASNTCVRKPCDSKGRNSRWNDMCGGRSPVCQPGASDARRPGRDAVLSRPLIKLPASYPQLRLPKFRSPRASKGPHQVIDPVYRRPHVGPAVSLGACVAVPALTRLSVHNEHGSEVSSRACSV